MESSFRHQIRTCYSLPFANKLKFRFLVFKPQHLGSNSMFLFYSLKFSPVTISFYTRLVGVFGLTYTFSHFFSLKSVMIFPLAFPNSFFKSPNVLLQEVFPKTFPENFSPSALPSTLCLQLFYFTNCRCFCS